MQQIALVVLIGLIGGVAIGFQAPLASLMSQRIGTLESVFIIHLGGAIAACVPLLVLGGGNLGAWRSVPWYALGAGTLGLVVISAISTAMPRLGIMTTVTLVVAAQLIVGALADHFGLMGAAMRPITLARLAGMALLFLGAWLIMRR